ncbi:MAG: Na+/H+ antiporter NhaA [Acidobacteriaceae bacterium]
MRASLIARAVRLPVQEFIHTQGVSSAVLLLAAVVALVWANSPWRQSYHQTWHTVVTLSGLRLSLDAWINDAMMAVFFFLMGMEIKQEIVHGELSTFRRAALPVFAALGGMIAPALIYTAFNYGQPTAHGWGIPMATDIAFSLGVLALIKGIPSELKVFLLTLAIADDIGAIIVIAFAYTSALHWHYLLIAAALIAIILICRRIGFGRQVFYTIIGVLVWFAVLRSGVHPTIAGVILGLLMPATSSVSLEEFRDLSTDTIEEFREAHSAGDTARANRLLGALDYLVRNTESPAERVTRKLNDWVAFLVLPLFALANAGVAFSAEGWRSFAHSPVAWGIVLGLVAGKPIGILATCWLTTKLGIAQIPPSIRWRQLACVAVLAGIGFTVSLFIGGLSFTGAAPLNASKIAILVASLVSGSAGFVLLKSTASQPKV